MAEYIEREALRKAFNRVRWFENADRDVIANELLSQMPTADVVEVRHGEWFLLDECANEGVYCSVCRKKVYQAQYYANQKIKSKYCPNCGAKMDGKGEGE